MATTIQVAGPTKVLIDANILGYSDNDNLPSISLTDNQHEIKTVLSGAAPEEVVLMGLTARISVALVKWDEDILKNMLIALRGVSGAAGKSTVGRRLVSSGGSFGLTIESVNYTQKYVFARSFLVADGMVDSQWGNRERVLTLTFMAIPDSGGTTYTYTPLA